MGFNEKMWADTRRNEEEIESIGNVGTPIEKYGGVGDDSTDCTQAFIDAIADGVTGIVLEPYKTYRISTSINITSDVVVFGLNSSIRVLDASAVFTSLNGSKSYLMGIVPRTVDGLDAISDNAYMRFTGASDFYNTKLSESSVMDIVSCGLQGQAEAPIGVVLHHYTDAYAMQIDNVGDANIILKLKNANNPTRRPDKPSNFLGSGRFMEFSEDAILGRGTLLEVDDDANYQWYKNETVVLRNNRATNSLTPAFEIGSLNYHKYMLTLASNGVKMYFVYIDTTPEVILQIPSAVTNGIKIQSVKGDIKMQTDEAGKTLLINGVRAGRFTSVPASKTAAGLTGDFSADANYMYMCYSSGNWIRVAKDGTW